MTLVTRLRENQAIGELVRLWALRREAADALEALARERDTLIERGNALLKTFAAFEEEATEVNKALHAKVEALASGNPYGPDRAV